MLLFDKHVINSYTIRKSGGKEIGKMFVQMHFATYFLESALYTEKILTLWMSLILKTENKL